MDNIWFVQNKGIHLCTRLNTPKKENMRIITTREIRQETKTFFELAEKEIVSIKRGKNKYINLIVTDSPDKKMFSEDWIKEFLSIPAEHRVNPFDVSPSGDMFFADRRNLERIEQSKESAKQGKTVELTPLLQKELFGEL